MLNLQAEKFHSEL